jgi:hypothetical protein
MGCDMEDEGGPCGCLTGAWDCCGLVWTGAGAALVLGAAFFGSKYRQHVFPLWRWLYSLSCLEV